MGRVVKANRQKSESSDQGDYSVSSATLFKLSGFNIYNTYKRKNISLKLAKIKKKSKLLG